jgi:maleylacetate reductase
LPYVIAYNAPAAPEAMERLRSALGVQDPATALFELSGELGTKRGLRDLGMGKADVDKAADLAVESPYWNPRPIERDAIRGLITRAWAGQPPNS